MNNFKLKDLVVSGRPITYGIVQPGPDIRPYGIPLIRGKDYSSGKVSLDDLYCVHHSIDLPYKRSKVKGNDLLLSIAGYVGQTAIVPSSLNGANITQTTARISCDSEKVLFKYLFYVFQSDEFQKGQVKKYEKGSAQSGLNLKDVGEFVVKLPSIPHQRKIAKILNTVDAVIEKTEAAIAKYKALKQGMMQNLFTRGIDSQTGKLRPGQKEAPELYKETELGWIPKEWEELRFADRTKVNQGLQIPIESRYKEDGENRFVYITIQYLNNLNSESYKYFIANPPSSVICNEEDILMVRTGNTGMVVTDICGAFHNNFFNIKYSSDLQKDFLVYYLLRSEIQQLILNYAGTTTIPDLKHRDFYRLPLLKPNLAEQDEIANRLIKIDKLIEKEQINLSKILSLKKGLMQDLLTGKVEVEV